MINRSVLSKALTGLAAVAGFALGACFDGLEAEGLPCETDAQCGPSLSCIDKYCGGRFACADGSFVEVEEVCNGAVACPDASDEDPVSCGTPTPNLCESDVAEAVEYSEGPETDGANGPIKVVVADVLGLGTAAEDIVLAGRNADFVKIFNIGMGPDSATEHRLDELGEIADFEVGDLDDDGLADIVVASDGDGLSIHVFRGVGSGMAPESYGAVASVDVPGEPEIRGIELGHFDEEDGLDLVVVVDGGDEGDGQVVTALGDPTAADMGESYFAPELSLVRIEYATFLDSAVADVDDDGLDDLIVSGEGQGPRMWILRRNGAGPMAWIELGSAEGSPTPGPAVDLAVGFVDGDDEIDVVSVDPMGNLHAFLNEGGNFMSRTIAEDLGDRLASVAIHDMNCDEFADFVVNVGDPAGIEILYGDGAGGVQPGLQVTIDSRGEPMGELGIDRFDQDQTPDIVQALETSGGPEVQMWFTSDPMMMPDDGM